MAYFTVRLVALAKRMSGFVLKYTRAFFFNSLLSRKYNLTVTCMVVLCGWNQLRLAPNTLVGRFHYNCRRERPASRLRKELSPRTPVQLHHLLCLKQVQFESCPSGDVAGAVVLASSLWFETGWQWIWIIAPLSAFGRIYYRAHYIADTIAGFFLGVIAFTALRVTDMTNLIPLSPYPSTLCSIIVQIVLASVLVKVVPHKLGIKAKRSSVFHMLCSICPKKWTSKWIRNGIRFMDILKI